jgi:predicted nucleic acid-binding protein
LSRYLLDVNNLIALIDPNHEFHLVAHAWFANLGEAEWLTCPINENGAIRVVCNRGYSSPTTIDDAVESVRVLRERGYHGFIVDSLSLTSSAHFDPSAIGSTNRLTDAYLIAMLKNQMQPSPRLTTGWSPTVSSRNLGTFSTSKQDDHTHQVPPGNERPPGSPLTWAGHSPTWKSRHVDNQAT